MVEDGDSERENQGTGQFWRDCAREKLDSPGRELDSGRTAEGDVKELGGWFVISE